MTDNSRFPALLIAKGWVEKLDKTAIPNIKNLIDASSSPPFDPEARVLAALAVRHDGDRLELRRHGPVTSIDQLLDGPEAEGQGDDAVGVLRLRRPRHALQRRRPLEGDDATLDQARSTRIQKGSTRARSASSPATTTPSRSRRRHCGRGRLVRRCRAAARRQPEAQVGDPEGRRHDLDRQHADPEGRQRRNRVDVHELRLRPEDRRPDRRVRQLRAPGQAARRRRSRRPIRRSAKNPLIFPTDEMLAQVHQFDSEGAHNDDYKAVAESARRLTTRREGAWAPTTGSPNRCSPVLLLAPGLAWLALFFLVPLGFLGYQSLQTGSFLSGTSSPGRAQLHGCGLGVQHAVHPLVPLRRDRDRCRLAIAIRWSTGSRSAAAAGRTSSCSSSSPPSSSPT